LCLPLGCYEQFGQTSGVLGKKKKDTESQEEGERERDEPTDREQESGIIAFIVPDYSMVLTFLFITKFHLPFYLKFRMFFFT
jgi:hypothetical protein